MFEKEDSKNLNINRQNFVFIDNIIMIIQKNKSVIYTQIAYCNRDIMRATYYLEQIYWLIYLVSQYSTLQHLGDPGWFEKSITWIEILLLN